MNATLGFYLLGAKRLLNERGGIYYGKTDDPNELRDNINEARRRVAFDAKLFRRIESFTINENITIYSLPTITNMVASSMNIFRIYATNNGITYPLGQYSYTDLMTKFLGSTAKSFPQAWAPIDQTKFRIGPIPNTTYSAELDIVTLPDDITDEAAADTILFPYADCVKYWAAYIAYARDKAYMEATNMLQRYVYEMTVNLGEAVHLIAARQYSQEIRTG